VASQKRRQLRVGGQRFPIDRRPAGNRFKECCNRRVLRVASVGGVGGAVAQA
jgi:hypothetical protein